MQSNIINDLGISIRNNDYLGGNAIEVNSNNAIAATTLNTTISGAVGFLSAWAFTSMNPVIGLVYGASYGLSGLVDIPLLRHEDKHGGKQPNNMMSQLIKAAARTAVAAYTTMQILGTTLSIKTALYFTASLITGAFVTSIAILMTATLTAHIIMSRKKEESAHDAL